jgi:hypothetical protein
MITVRRQFSDEKIPAENASRLNRGFGLGPLSHP